MRNGTLEKVGGQFVLRYERRLAHPREKVWAALVEPGDLARWFPAAIQGERRAGAPLRFVFENDDGPALEGAYRIFEPPRLLEYTWGDEILRWELTADGAGTLLVFTTTFAERADAPRDGAGWHLCLDALEALLAGGTPHGPDHGRWQEVYSDYLGRIGLGDFPKFLKEGSASSAKDAMHTPGMEGYAFEGARGARLELLRATRDAETAEHLVEGSAYLLLLEGSYRVHLAGHQFVLRPGLEFPLPPGVRFAGHVTAGTRMILGHSPRAPA